MNQPTRTTTHSVSDLEALRLQLEEDGKVYRNNRNPNSKEIRDRLLHTLQTNDCREIITATVDEHNLASVFVCAGGQSHVDILEAFLHYGMNIDIKDTGEWTALIDASFSGNEECVRFLLDRNAKVDVQNKSGMTALIHASMNNFIKIAEMLLEKNANPDLQSESKTTALMFASGQGYKEIVQLLLNHGANIELKNNDGKTALDLVDDEEIEEMIRNYVTNSYVLK